ncbi:MAG: low molecular weight phosphotyrosine protein phosphatase, partial [Bacteroidaceae bacterium]|nr:low molecular weight phosphotyrosine protein phosphatase [Bacteroidaceae bacterium]
DALKELAPTLEDMKKIVRMTDFCKHSDIDHVPDPYYGGTGGFEQVIDIVEDACEGLISSIQDN